MMRRRVGSIFAFVVFMLGVWPFFIYPWHDSGNTSKFVFVPGPVALLDPKARVEPQLVKNNEGNHAFFLRNITEQYVISFTERQFNEFCQRNNHSKLAPVTRIAGVDGYYQGNLDLWAELTDHRFEYVNASLFGRSQEDKDKHGSPHAIGCYLAHWHLIRMLNDRPPQLRPVLYFMFENDAWCIPDLQLRTLQLRKQLPSDWDMLFIGGKPFTYFNRIPSNGSSSPQSLRQEICRGDLGKGDSPLAPDGSRNLSIAQPYWKTKFITNTDAYVINPQRISRVVDVLDPKKIRSQVAIDETLAHAMKASKLNVFMTTEKWCTSIDHMNWYSVPHMNKPVPWVPSFFIFSNDKGEGKNYIQQQIHIENCTY